MITKTLRTISGKIKVTIPTDLTEITIGQMIAANKDPENACVIFAPILTKEVLDNVTDFNDLTDVRDRVLSLAHQIKYCYDAGLIPEYINFGQTRVKVIKDLSIEPAGAFLSARDIIATEINRHEELYGDEWRAHFNPDLDCMAMVLAHYFYCRATGKLYVEKLAEEFKEEVLKLPLQTALPIARSFFLNYPNLFKPKTSLWERLRQSWRNAQVLRRLKSSSSTTP